MQSVFHKKADPRKGSFASRDFITHRKIVDDITKFYLFGNRLGDGGYGTVYACTNKITGIEHAIKVVPKQPKICLENHGEKKDTSYDSFVTRFINGDSFLGHIDNDNVENNIDNGNDNDVPVATTDAENRVDLREFCIAKQLDHPSVVQVYECLEDADYTYLVMELMKGGDLGSAIQTKHGLKEAALSETNAAIVIHKILSAINYSHATLNIAHLDLKLENIMVCDDDFLMDIKICDFGLSCPIEYEVDAQTGPKVKRMTNVAGSPSNISPQVLNGLYDPIKSDVWSIGVIAFCLLAGELPFDGCTVSIMQKIKQHSEATMFGQRQPYYHVTQNWSEDCKNFIRQLLSFDEETRPTAAQALQHPWLATIMQQNNTVLGLMVQERDSPQSYGVLVSSLLDDFLSADKRVIPSTTEACHLWKEATKCLLVKHIGVTGGRKKLIDTVFRAWDIDHTGVLTKAKIMAGLDRFQVKLSKKANEKFVDAILVHAPSLIIRGQKVLSYSAFVEAIVGEELLQGDELLKLAFRIFCKGGNYITRRTLKETLGNHRPGIDSLVDQMLEDAADNLPGLVSYAEFKRIVTGDPLTLPLVQHNNYSEIVFGDTSVDEDIATFFLSVLTCKEDESIENTKRSYGGSFDLFAKRPRIAISDSDDDSANSSKSGISDCNSCLGSFAEHSLVSDEDPYESVFDDGILKPSMSKLFFV